MNMDVHETTIPLPVRYTVNKVHLEKDQYPHNLTRDDGDDIKKKTEARKQKNKYTYCLRKCDIHSKS